MNNPIMYALANPYQDDVFMNFVTEEDDHNFPSFAHLLPSRPMAEQYIEDQLSDGFEIVEVEIVSYRADVLQVEYAEPKSWQSGDDEDKVDEAEKTDYGFICEHGSLKRKCLVCELESDLKIAVEALRKMDVRKNGMLPRSEMARIAIAALEKIDGVSQ